MYLAEPDASSLCHLSLVPSKASAGASAGEVQPLGQVQTQSCGRHPQRTPRAQGAENPEKADGEGPASQGALPSALPCKCLGARSPGLQGCCLEVPVGEATYSLFGPVVRDGTVQGDAVAELCIVPVFLELAFRLLAVIPQCGRHATLAQASWPLHQTNGLGKTWWEKRRGQAGSRSYRVPPPPSSPPRPDSPFLLDASIANFSRIAEFQL